MIRHKRIMGRQGKYFECGCGGDVANLKSSCSKIIQSIWIKIGAGEAIVRERDKALNSCFGDFVPRRLKTNQKEELLLMFCPFLMLLVSRFY